MLICGQALLSIFLGVSMLIQAGMEGLNLARQGVDLLGQFLNLQIHLLKLDDILEIRMHFLSSFEVCDPAGNLKARQFRRRALRTIFILAYSRAARQEISRRNSPGACHLASNSLPT
jgi:hypothetical protein